MATSIAPNAPIISNFRHDTGVQGDHITNETTPTLIITADAGSIVDVYSEGTLLGRAVESTTPGVFSYTTGVLENSHYQFTAIATNVDEVSSDPSAIFDLTIDSAAPAAPSITDIFTDTANAHDHVTSDVAPTLVIEAEAGSAVTIYKDGAAIGTAIELSQPGAFIFSVPADLAEGTYVFTAKAADVAGNTGAVSSDFTVVIDHTDPEAPLITGFATDTGTTGDNLTNDNTPTLTISAEHGSTVEVFDGETSLGFATETETDGEFSFVAEDSFDDGTLHLTAVATDLAGNSSAVSPQLALTIDTAAPEIPTITGFDSDSGVTGDFLTSDTSPTLTITAEAGSTVTVFFNGEAVGTAVEDAEVPGTFTFSSEDLIDGEFTFTAVATDAAGNDSDPSETFDITVDHTAPEAPVIGSVDRGTIEVSAEAGSTVLIYRDGALVGAAIEDSEGVFLLDDEDYGPGVTYTATATDAAANTSELSDPVVSNHTPVITSGSGDEVTELHINENTTAVTIVTATDVDQNHLTYSLGDTFDADAFSIDAETGVLTLLQAADYETPADFFGQGAYEVTVVVSDGEFSTAQNLSIVIDDVEHENLVGSDDGERLVAANADSTINAGGGDDLLITGSGNDRLDGGTGADVMVGGAGNDVYYVDDLSDQVVERVSSFGSVTDSGGKDTVYSTISLDMNTVSQPLLTGRTLIFKETLPGSLRNIEQLFLRGADNLNGFGNALDNRIAGNDGINHLIGRGGNDVITGGAGGDTLNGGDGNDKLYGGDGNDRLVGGAGKDAFIFNAALNGATNKDVVQDFSHEEGDRLQLSKSVFGALSLGKLSADSFYAAADARGAHDANDHIIYNTTTGALFYDVDGKGGAAAVRFATVGGEDHPALAISDFLIIA